MRTLPLIRRSDYVEESHDSSNWFEAFLQAEAAQGKTAVEAARSRQQSVLDQLSAILMGPSFTSVEAKVEELAERSGLKAFWQAKQGGINIDILPSAPDSLREDIKTFISNKVESFHGLIAIPAIQEEVFQTFRGKGVSAEDLEAPEFKKFISDIILSTRKNQPTGQDHQGQLGKGESLSDLNEAITQNQDFWAGCMPNKI